MVFILNDHLNASLMSLFTPIICYQQQPFEIYYHPSPKLADKQNKIRFSLLFRLTQVCYIGLKGIYCLYNWCNCLIKLLLIHTRIVVFCRYDDR